MRSRCCRAEFQNVRGTDDLEIVRKLVKHSHAQRRDTSCQHPCSRRESLERMFSNVIAWFRRKRDERRSALMFERQVVVKMDDAGIAAAYPGGEVQAISWSDVQCVAIETNDSGPWGADVWWLLEGGTRRCAYPGGATGEREALAEYPKRFSGFSEAEKVRSALACRSMHEHPWFRAAVHAIEAC